MNANTNLVEIKISKFWFWANIIFGLLSILGVVGLFFIINAFRIRAKRIEIINMDAKYKSWFKRLSIKNIESFDVGGIWVFNSVRITGRGSSEITMFGVSNLKQIKQIAEKIEHLKD